MLGDSMTGPMITMGRVVGAWGVTGWIKVRPFTATPEGLCGYTRWWLGAEGARSEVAVEEASVHSDHVVARLAGVDDRERAAALKGKEVALPRQALPETGVDEYYWADLIGLKVVNLQGDELGEVAEVFSNGAHGILRIGEGKGGRLIPFVAPVVGKVDLDARRIDVDWGKDW
ncbi:MAG: ribosome maturation factor RimM [Burkholderiales bacterium]